MPSKYNPKPPLPCRACGKLLDARTRWCLDNPKCQQRKYGIYLKSTVKRTRVKRAGLKGNSCRCCNARLRAPRKWCQDNQKCQTHKKQYKLSYQTAKQVGYRTTRRKTKPSLMPVQFRGVGKAAPKKSKKTKTCVKCNNPFTGPNIRRCPACVSSQSDHHAGIVWEGF